jgi:F-type H+-transporting ATPase subunit a
VVSGHLGVLASDLPFPPSVEDFYLPGWMYPWVTKFTVLIWIGAAAVIIYFLMAYRNPKLVPTKRQWVAESIYGFARNNVAIDVIGHEGARFAPYLASLFSFLLIVNIFGILPFAQISPNAHIAFPAALAIITYILYNWVGIRKHGFGKYLKLMLMPPAPMWLMPLLLPIEFLQNFILRPVTLSLRLFANMFAGHVILLVFALSGFALINANALLAPVSVLSWVMTILLTFFELLVAAMQAYVFTLLTAVYVQGSLADEH